MYSVEKMPLPLVLGNVYYMRNSLWWLDEKS